MKEKKAYADMAAAQVEEEKKEVEDKKQAKIDSFKSTVNKSSDLVDQFQDLVDHLKEFSGATAVHIGKLVVPKKKIEEGDNDTAHEDPDAAKIIHF